MYRVTIYNDGTATVIHEISADPADPHLYNCKLTEGAPGEIDSVEFTILPNNPGYELLTSRTTLIEIYDSKKGKNIFSGRILTITPEMQDSGLVFKSAVCESRLGYLCDSVQPYTEEATYTLEGFFKLLLANHNTQVEDYKKIYPGIITAAASASTGNVTKGLNYQTTWEAISDKLLSTEGGEIELREGDDGLLYLDYVEELGEQIDTVTIELGVNMRSITREIDPTSVVTRLIPLGAKLDDENGNETEERLTIASVNGGSLYLDDEKSQETYGIVVGTVTWDDVTVADNLLTKGTQWLQSQSMTDKITITAYDLSLIGLAEDSIERNNYYQVINSAIGISRYYRVAKRVVNICEPSDITYEMGERSSSLAATIISNQKQTEAEESERAAAIRRLNNKLSNSSGLFMTEETQSDGSIVYYMHDHQSMADSDIIWKLTAEAFGISLDGGKTYPYGFTVTGEMVMALIDVEELFAQDITATGTISGATIKGAAISGSTITGGTITGGTINGGTINSATLNAATGSFSSTSGNYATSITGGKISLQYTGSGSTIDIYASGASLAIKNSVEGNTSIQLPNQASIMFENESGSYTAAIHYGSDYRLTLTGYAGVDVTSTLYTRDVLPYKDNYYSLGTSSYRWATIYATSGTVSTSDRNKKHDIKPVSDKYMDFFYKLSAVSYMKNGGDRTHIGGISQDVLEALKAAGLTAEDFGGFCQDEKIAYAEHGEDGHGIESSKYVVTDEDGNPEYDYGLRYEEFIFLCVEAIQRQKKEIDTLKDAVAKLATAA